ncbi:putative uncharacterized protein [Pseudomonas sp. StFLB209]|nr:putative uncharacterized protein [Pseudomonas sp. StFLB209]
MASQTLTVAPDMPVPLRVAPSSERLRLSGEAGGAVLPSDPPPSPLPLLPAAAAAPPAPSTPRPAIAKVWVAPLTTPALATRVSMDESSVKLKPLKFCAL